MTQYDDKCSQLFASSVIKKPFVSLSAAGIARQRHLAFLRRIFLMAIKITILRFILLFQCQSLDRGAAGEKVFSRKVTAIEY